MCIYIYTYTVTSYSFQLPVTITSYHYQLPITVTSYSYQLPVWKTKDLESKFFVKFIRSCVDHQKLCHKGI